MYTITVPDTSWWGDGMERGLPLGFSPASFIPLCGHITGSGKTHSMLGTPQHPGCNVLTLRDLFSFIEDDENFEYTVEISYLEVGVCVFPR